MPDRDLLPTECLMTIAGTGSYVPERVLTNAELEKSVETSDEWITTRTGIKERRIAAPGETTSDMATMAARRAMEMAGVTAAELELIIVATVTPDTIFPSTACYVWEPKTRSLLTFRRPAPGFCMRCKSAGISSILAIAKRP